MRSWTFWDFESESGEVPIQHWYAQQDAHVRAQFDWHVHMLRAVNDWLIPPIKEFACFERHHLPLSEMRFRADDLDLRGRSMRGRRIRPVGLYRPEPEYRDFILFGAAEKMSRGAVYIPEDALEKALKHYEAFRQGKGRLRQRGR